MQKKLSFWSKLCFAIGGIPYNMCNVALGLYLAPFLLEIGEVKFFVLKKNV